MYRFDTYDERVRVWCPSIIAEVADKIPCDSRKQHGLLIIENALGILKLSISCGLQEASSWTSAETSTHLPTYSLLLSIWRRIMLVVFNEPLLPPSHPHPRPQQI